MALEAPRRASDNESLIVEVDRFALAQVSDNESLSVEVDEEDDSGDVHLSFQNAITGDTCYDGRVVIVSCDASIGQLVQRMGFPLEYYVDKNFIVGNSTFSFKDVYCKFMLTSESRRMVTRDADGKKWLDVLIIVVSAEDTKKKKTRKKRLQ